MAVKCCAILQTFIHIPFNRFTHLISWFYLVNGCSLIHHHVHVQYQTLTISNSSLVGNRFAVYIKDYVLDKARIIHKGGICLNQSGMFHTDVVFEGFSFEY